MTHLRIADGDDTVLRDALANAFAAAVWIRLDVLLDDAAHQCERVRHRRLVGVGLHLATHPSLEELGLLDDDLKRVMSFSLIAPVDVECGFDARTLERRKSRAIDAGRRRDRAHYLRHGAADQISRVFDAAGTFERRRVEDRLQILPAKLLRMLRNLDRPLNEPLIEIVFRHLDAETHEAALPDREWLATDDRFRRSRRRRGPTGWCIAAAG